MSPGGQSNLLLIRRLLHPSTPGFDHIRGRFFAQVLPKFFSREKPQGRLRISASQPVVLIKKILLKDPRSWCKVVDGKAITFIDGTNQH